MKLENENGSLKQENEDLKNRLSYYENNGKTTTEPSNLEESDSSQ